LQGIIQSCARPRGLHHHRLDDEGRILAAAEPEVGGQSCDRRRDHEIDDERAVLECPFREVEAGHHSDPISRTFRPGYRTCTPAVTTISPISSPWEITTVAWS